MSLRFFVPSLTIVALSVAPAALAEDLKTKAAREGLKNLAQEAGSLYKAAVKGASKTPKINPLRIHSDAGHEAYQALHVTIQSKLNRVLPQVDEMKWGKILSEGSVSKQAELYLDIKRFAFGARNEKLSGIQEEIMTDFQKRLARFRPESERLVYEAGRAAKAVKPVMSPQEESEAIEILSRLRHGKAVHSPSYIDELESEFNTLRTYPLIRNQANVSDRMGLYQYYLRYIEDMNFGNYSKTQAAKDIDRLEELLAKPSSSSGPSTQELMASIQSLMKQLKNRVANETFGIGGVVTAGGAVKLLNNDPDSVNGVSSADLPASAKSHK